MKRDNAILFDLDGTLIDSTPAIVESFFAAFKKHNFPAPKPEDIMRLIGLPLEDMFELLGVGKEEVATFVKSYKEHYRGIFLQKTTLLPNAKEAVIEASKIALLGAVTTKTSLFSKKLLEHFGILGYFDIIIGRQEVYHPKPHPEGVEKALAALKAGKEKSFMVGDTCIDMEAAKNATIQGVGVLSGYASKEQLSKCAHHIVSDALEAVDLIKKLI